MSYLGELRQNVRPLTAASLGAATSLPLFAYTNSVFAPHLIAEFGWSRAQFALVGVTMLITLVLLPVIGRITDVAGVRRVALVGTLLILPCYIAYSLMQGSFMMFLVIFAAVLIVGSMTSPLTYSRIIAERFERAQGLALTVMNCAPAVLAIVLVPLLNLGIEAYGWRAAYVALGCFVFVFGGAAVLLTPKAGPDVPPQACDRAVSPEPLTATKTAREDFTTILRSRVFWIIVVAMFLCMLQTPLHSGQMNIMLQDNGLNSQSASNIVSFYAFGTIVGRIVCGLALDRYSTRIVATISLGLPAIGYFLLGTSLDMIWVISISMFIVGLSVGAESDLMAYLVSRYFKINIFSTTFGLTMSASFLSSATGALLISLTLTMFDSFAPFLFLVAGAVTVGSLLYLLVPGRNFEKIG